MYRGNHNQRYHRSRKPPEEKPEEKTYLTRVSQTGPAQHHRYLVMCAACETSFECWVAQDYAIDPQGRLEIRGAQYWRFKTGEKLPWEGPEDGLEKLSSPASCAPPCPKCMRRDGIRDA